MYSNPTLFKYRSGLSTDVRTFQDTAQGKHDQPMLIVDIVYDANIRYVAMPKYVYMGFVTTDNRLNDTLIRSKRCRCR